MQQIQVLIPFAIMTPDCNDIIVTDSMIGSIAKCSVLDLQLFSNRTILNKRSAQERVPKRTFL